MLEEMIKSRATRDARTMARGETFVVKWDAYRGRAQLVRKQLPPSLELLGCGGVASLCTLLADRLRVPAKASSDAGQGGAEGPATATNASSDKPTAAKSGLSGDAATSRGADAATATKSVRISAPTSSSDAPAKDSSKPSKPRPKLTRQITQDALKQSEEFQATTHDATRCIPHATYHTLHITRYISHATYRTLNTTR